MEIDDKIKEELHLHTLAMDEQSKIKARLLGESDYFNRILEMNTETERRKFAAMAMQGLLSNPNVFNDVVSRKKYYPQIAEDAIKAADALLMAFNMENLKEATDKIAELNKKKDGK